MFIFTIIMKPPTDIYELIYVSTMAPTSPISVVASIAAMSRKLNALKGITGMLIFDGLRFCQQFEGNQEDVLALFERISRDPRHDAVTLIYHGPLQARRFKSFSLAFTSADDIEVLSRLEALKGHTGLAAFSELLPTLDCEIPR